MDLALACEQEIVGLHQFFEHWFRGGFADQESGFRRFDQVMAPGFMIISPRGVATERAQLAQELRSAFGSWRDAASEQSTITVEGIQLRHLGGGLALFSYVERQNVRGSATARISSALMQRHEGGPNGVWWLHVHETWMPGSG